MVAAEPLGGRYRLVERLGSGGMSVVWRGYDEVLQRWVAVKLLSAELSVDPAFHRRLQMEARAAARLSHPHIAGVYDYGTRAEGDPRPYVVMELVPGPALGQRLARGRTLHWREAALACAQVAAGLAFAHAHGVVHRDVTPGNVLLGPTGAKLVDFGISALVGELDQSPDGQILGTPAYLAPERLDGGPAETATDVYALGLLFYRALTGELPWRASTRTEILRAHRYVPPAPIPHRPDLPDQLRQLCRQCLAKSPADRPSSAEVAGTLAAVAADAADQRLPVRPPPRGRWTEPAVLRTTVVGAPVLPPAGPAGPGPGPGSGAGAGLGAGPGAGIAARPAEPRRPRSAARLLQPALALLGLSAPS